jgi:hypothetical protein
MLATVIRRYWHALVRDLLALGYRASDMFTPRLTWAELVSVVVGAHPQTSVRFFLDSGWTREAHLLANMAEGQAGIAKLAQPYARAGLDQRMPDPMGGGNKMQMNEYTWDEFDELERKRYEKAHKAAPGTTRVRVL